ncbi:MAG: hypothetical protein ACE5IA_07670, partial [Dehalococcoidia bacterium]
MVEQTKRVAPLASFMLRTGKTHQENGNIYQAIYDYFNIINRFSDSGEAKDAYDRLVRIAQDFEEDGQLYAAKHLYQR